MIPLILYPITLLSPQFSRLRSRTQSLVVFCHLPSPKNASRHALRAQLWSQEPGVADTSWIKTKHTTYGDLAILNIYNKHVKKKTTTFLGTIEKLFFLKKKLSPVRIKHPLSPKPWVFVRNFHIGTMLNTGVFHFRMGLN